MKNLKYLFVFFLFGCSVSKVIYDYDVKTNFSNYKSYDFFEDFGENLNDLDVKRFQSALNFRLDSLDLKKSTRPDFFIHLISDKRENNNGNNVGVGVGGGTNVGVGISTGISFGGNKTVETFMLDFVDAKTNKLFWQASIDVQRKENLKPKERIELVNTVIEKMLAKYPPKKN